MQVSDRSLLMRCMQHQAVCNAVTERVAEQGVTCTGLTAPSTIHHRAPWHVLHILIILHQFYATQRRLIAPHIIITFSLSYRFRRFDCRISVVLLSCTLPTLQLYNIWMH